MKIILSNLLSNAVKYTEEAGAIRIYAEKGWFYLENSFASLDSGAEIRAKNNSESYDEEKFLDTEKLYALNFDLNKENSNGLGLYIVSTLLNNYKIPYETLEKDGKFVFRIKLS